MKAEEYFPGSLARRRNWVVKLNELTQHPICWVCGYDWGKWNLNDQRNYQTHHIQRRSSCYPGWHDVECNLFAACQHCHETLLAAMPHARQLALKKINDPRHYDLELWHHCRDGPELKSAERVTDNDVLSNFPVGRLTIPQTFHALTSRSRTDDSQS